MDPVPPLCAPAPGGHRTGTASRADPAVPGEMRWVVRGQLQAMVRHRGACLCCLPCCASSPCPSLSLQALAGIQDCPSLPRPSLPCPGTLPTWWQHHGLQHCCGAANPLTLLQVTLGLRPTSLLYHPRCGQPCDPQPSLLSICPARQQGRGQRRPLALQTHQAGHGGCPKCLKTTGGEKCVRMEANTGQFSHCCWSCLLRASSPCWWAWIWLLPSYPTQGQANTHAAMGRGSANAP